MYGKQILLIAAAVVCISNCDSATVIPRGSNGISKFTTDSHNRLTQLGKMVKDDEEKFGFEETMQDSEVTNNNSPAGFGDCSGFDDCAFNNPKECTKMKGALWSCDCKKCTDLFRGDKCDVKMYCFKHFYDDAVEEAKLQKALDRFKEQTH